jgi:8-oxo-dGTP pyrophosphatase MutT (NUDIX family)
MVAGMSVMQIAVAVLRDEEHRLLLVRKHGTPAFMQPGGKIEEGEDARAALARELYEELGIIVAQDRLRYLGRADAPAANEPGVTVAAEIFELGIDPPIEVQAEIAEAVWIDPADPRDLVLAPLTRDHILPLAMAMA